MNDGTMTGVGGTPAGTAIRGLALAAALVMPLPAAAEYAVVCIEEHRVTVVTKESFTELPVRSYAGKKVSPEFQAFKKETGIYGAEEALTAFFIHAVSGMLSDGWKTAGGPFGPRGNCQPLVKD